MLRGGNSYSLSLYRGINHEFQIIRYPAGATAASADE
jgi:hypothetical protein